MVDVSASVEIDGFRSRETVTPTSAEELADALHQADQQQLAVAPLGGGTQLDLGNPPARLDLALQTTGLNRVVEYEPADLTVTVEAGLRFAELQKTLAEQGQMLALDPPTMPDATIGGLVATNASGPLRFAHGTARDLVIGTRVANTDGALTRAGGRVVKNVAGYDLNKLHVGGLGTLGVIVELSFKLAPIPPALGTILGQFPEVSAARDLLAAVVHSWLSPLAIELVGSGVLGTGAAVVLRVGGYPEAVERQVRDLRALVEKHGGEPFEANWDEITAIQLAAQRKAVVLKAAAPIAQTTALIEVIQQGLPGCVAWAHAGNGIAYAACDQVPEAESLLELRRRVVALGRENASLVVQRCPTVLKRSVDVWGEPGPALVLMRALKQKLDPNNTLNPGRYVGGI
jgi:glycolate oxidase FAD binding subunit